MIHLQGKYHTVFPLSFVNTSKQLSFLKCLCETYSKKSVQVKHLSDTFSIQNGLNQGDALLSLPLSFALENTIRNIQKNQMGLKLNETLQLVYADDVNLLRDNINTIKKNTQALTDVSKLSLQANAEKTKYTVTYIPTARQQLGKHLPVDTDSG
jgi:hypothetical protein